MLEVGTKAPAFTLPDQNGNPVSLSDFQGKNVILFFYSKDNTSGCTKQACTFGEQYPAFQEKGAVVLGVSKDPVASHQRFADKYQLPYQILSDPECQVLAAYDVWKEKNMYGKKVMGVIRSSYLIDGDGIIRKVHAKVKPEENAGLALADLEEGTALEEVYAFLKDCKTYYLATVEGKQPRVRPFGTVDLFEGKLYFQTGKVKDVSKQMTANPRVEFCAFDGSRWLRMAAQAVEDDRYEARKHMLDAYPSLRKNYQPDDGNTQVFYLKDAVATFSSFTEAPRTLRF